MTSFLSFEEVTDPQRLQPFVNRLLIPTEVDEALHQESGVAIGVSGGKDSSALLIVVSALIRTRYPHVEIVALHADTGMEWQQTEPHLRDITNRLGIPLHIVRREKGDLIQRIQQRYEYLQSGGKTDTPMWPDARNRYCTGELKTAPADSWSRQWRPSGIVIHSLGIRAQESHQRARKTACTPRPKITTKTRTGLTWHPILQFSLKEVWQVLGVELHQLKTLQQRVRDFLQAGQGDVFSYIRNAGFYGISVTRWAPPDCPVDAVYWHPRMIYEWVRSIILTCIAVWYRWKSIQDSASKMENGLAMSCHLYYRLKHNPHLNLRSYKETNHTSKTPSPIQHHSNCHFFEYTPMAPLRVNRVELVKRSSGVKFS